ncbi:hypothetical protein LR48_Vigan07g007000 [Vigna angularis]|uniref:Uncharacterized protein n=1 Tax=Phaseolus angularis TaxID=3914 RepID=A0A0L9UUG5_PHAAN|nr:hypothetical protein LR48_Vigan07g007000 [Vigna angularis]
MEDDTPSSTGTDQHFNLANINPDGSIDKAIGKSVGRVKVKLRTPKMLDSQPTSSDAPTQSDTDKSSQQHGLEKQGLSAERMEDSANSLPDMKLSNLSKRAGSIKIKSSKVLGSNAEHTSKPLSASTEIIRKVMKMDAAEPFNVPVNPEALGIPCFVLLNFIFFNEAVFYVLAIVNNVIDYKAFRRVLFWILELFKRGFTVVTTRECLSIALSVALYF